MVLALKSWLPEFTHAIAKELCNILDISILMNMLAFKHNLRAMSNEVVTSWEFPYFAIPPNLYKKSDAVAMLAGEQKATRNQVLKEEKNYINIR